MYKLTNLADTIIRLEDGAFIPTSEKNQAYREYLEWVEKGNTAEAADPPPPVVPSEMDELKERVDALERKP